MRIGFGYDLHVLVEGRPLILGGVNIPHTKGLLGHSDADCLTHAIADALLGAAGLEDIGHHFPDTDPQYKNLSSQVLLKFVADKIAALGFQIGNIDSTVIAQSPKLAPYLDKMKATLAQTLNIHPAQIGIKATTNEKMDAIGMEKAIATHAVALLERRSS